MWLGSDCDKGDNMRIPLTEADWPSGFNDVSKYIAKKWPGGKLKFNKAREVTAFLLGYQSVHDAKNSLLEAIPDLEYSTKEFQRSMTVRALARFDSAPSIGGLFGSITWSVLTVWKRTTEYKSMKALSNPPSFEESWATGGSITFNEFKVLKEGSYDQKTPKALVELIDSGKIPDHDYMVNTAGDIYRFSELERLVDQLGINEQDLGDLNYTKGVSEFIYEQLLPRAWRPLKPVIVAGDHQGYSPYMHVVEHHQTGYKIFHRGHHAYYDIVCRSEAQLHRLLELIFKGEPVSRAPASSGSFQIDGNWFSHSEIFKRNTVIKDSPWLREIPLPDLDPDLPNIPQTVILRDSYETHKRVEQLLTQEISDFNFSSEQAEGIFREILGPEKQTLEHLQQQGDFTVDTEYFFDEDELNTAIAENEDRINEAKNHGRNVLEYHPELRPYFDEVAACMAYQESVGNRRDYFISCNRRECDFINDVFFNACLHIQFSPHTHSPEFKVLAKMMFKSLIDGELKLNNLPSACSDSASLVGLYKQQKDWIDDLVCWAKHKQISIPGLASIGGPASIIRKSKHDMLLDEFSAGRKWTGEEFTTES